MKEYSCTDDLIIMMRYPFFSLLLRKEVGAVKIHSTQQKAKDTSHWLRRNRRLKNVDYIFWI